MHSDSIEIRTLRSNEDCQAAADFQREIWGTDYGDIVPGTLLHVVDYVGGLAAGAFDPSGTLVGFVFGMNGIRDGDLVHWSHMLGVRESARNSGLGRMLKEYQRTTLRDIGVKRIYWTFDPLMSKNAYFNINRLGAEIVEYVPDMYGRTSSPLHLGLPTDRLIACLPTLPREVVRRPAPDARTPVLTAFPKLDDHTVSVREHAPETALIEIPPDILDVLDQVKADGATHVVVIPLGFISDHMEVLFDLDHEAMDRAQELGLHMERVATVGTHPRFVAMVRELIVERMTSCPERLALGSRGPSHDICPLGCCLLRSPESVRRTA